MMWFPELPVFNGDSSGLFCIPEELSPNEEIVDEDPFVKLLIEVMSRPARGGTHG